MILGSESLRGQLAIMLYLITMLSIQTNIIYVLMLLLQASLNHTCAGSANARRKCLVNIGQFVG